MSAESQSDDSTAAECAPCRGTGTVISNLGGTRSEVACPWCEGTGRRTPGHDTQAPRRQDPSV